MKAVVALLLSLATLAGPSAQAQETGKSVIELEKLQQMFAQMRTKSKWNVDAPLLWGYFFTDRNADKLQPAASALQKQGYRLVNIYPTDDKSTFFLHVEKVERHTPESLAIRNQELEELARKYKLDSYDGMDVGPVAP